MELKEGHKEVYLLHQKPKMIFVILGLILIIQGVFDWWVVAFLLLTLF